MFCRAFFGAQDIDEVAAGIRESLEAEHQWLLATIATGLHDALASFLPRSTAKCP